MTGGVVIAGAGLAGLACARALGTGYRIFERDDRPGGLCRTERKAGFTIDDTGHYLHFRDPEVRTLVGRLLGRNLIGRPRDSWVYVNGTMTPYPFQANTMGHDPRVVRECVVGLFRALEGRGPAPRDRSYASWIRATFGDGFARHFMLPFNRKQFRSPVSRLLPLQGGRFLPRPDPEDIVRGALKPQARRFGYNANLWHPRRGGIETLPRALAAGLARPVTCGAELTRVRWRERVAEIGGRAFPYDVLVSSLPLPVLVRRLAPRPSAVAAAGSRLRWIGVVTVHVLVRRARERRRHWVYVPGPEHVFYRYGFPTNINPADAPRGAGIVSAEVSYVPGRKPAAGRLANRVVRDLRRAGAVGPPRDVVGIRVVDFPCAYVLFDRAYPGARARCLDFLARHGIMSIGRYGGWVYGGMEDAIREGLDAGRLIRAAGRRAPMRHAGSRA